MKIGVSLYSYGADIHARRMTLRDAIDHAASLDIDGIEIVAEQVLPNWGRPQLPELVGIRDYLGEKGLELANFSCYLNDRVRTDRPQTRQELIDTAHQSIELAALMGAKVIRPVYLNLSEAKGGVAASAQAEREQDLVEIIRACVPALEAKGLTWALEIHAPFPVAFYADVLKAVDSPRVKLLPDFSCWQTSGLPSEYQNNPISTFVEILPDTVHCHGKGHVFDEDGEEPHTPYRELLGALNDFGYEGYVVAEFEGWWMADHDSRAEVEKHVALLKRHSGR